MPPNKKNGISLDSRKFSRKIKEKATHSPSCAHADKRPLSDYQKTILQSFQANCVKHDMKYAGEKVVRGLRLHQQSTRNQQTATIDPAMFADIETGEFIPENTVARALYGHVLLT